MAQPLPQAQEVPTPPPDPPRTAVGTLEPPPPPPRPPVRTPSWGPGLCAVLAVLLGVWIVGVTVVVQAGGWLVADAVTAISGLPTSGWAWIGLAWGTALLVAVPSILLGVLARAVAPTSRGVRASARAWALAGLCAGVLGSARAVPTAQNEALLLLTAVLAAALAVPIFRRRRPGGVFGGHNTAAGATAFGLAAGLFMLLPWAWWGSLGGLTETVCALLAAAATGWLASTIVDDGLFAWFRRSRPWLVIVGGLAAGVALTPLGSGVGGPGVSVAEMFALPALGLVAAALSAATGPPLGRGWFSYGPPRFGTPRLAVALMVGVAAVGPVAFVDSEETSILLGTRDLGFWALVATAVAGVIGLVVAVLYAVLLSPNRTLHRWLPATVVAVVGLAAMGTYAAAQPGLHGERLFVIMAERPDLSGLDAIADRPARLRATYERLVAHAERTQAPLRRTLDRYHLSYTPYYLVNGIAVDGGPIVRQWLSSRSDVDRVLIDQVLRPLPGGRLPPTNTGDEDAPNPNVPQWNISLIGADRVWRELDDNGAGIVIGNSDSGVDGTHPALRDGFRGGEDSWYDPWNGTTAPTDHNGHGTHTTGTAVGRDGIGVAPGAQWMGCVNLDRNLGSPSHYLDCLQFMLAPFRRGGDPWRDGRPERAPHVLTNSWGCPEVEGCDDGALTEATAALTAAGIYVVVAAGNTGPGCGSVRDAPAPYPDVLTVGAVDSARRVADWSSRGPTSAGLPKPDVVAPGVNVLSAKPHGTWAADDGTSMATPHVAGVVALMWSAQPRLIGDIGRTTEILRRTAVPIQASARCGSTADSEGAGLVDAFAAVSAARALGA